MPTPEFKSEFFEKYGVSPEDADINTFASIFDEAYGVKLDGANIKTAVSNILINNSSPEEREQKLKEYVKESFHTFAVPHAKQSQISWVDTYDYSTQVDTVGMLDLYINFVSYAVAIASDEQLESMKKAQEEAKKSAKEAIDIANKASDEANKARENKEFGAKQKIEDANKLVERAKLRMERANNPDNFYFRSWEPGMPKFGLTSAEARKIFIDCANNVNSIKYAELRSEQIDKYGVTNPMFMISVRELDTNPNVIDYNSAKPDDQERLRNVYVTRQLINTRLERFNRRNWFWRFFNRSQIKAAQNYVNAVDGLLSKVKFPENLKEPTMTAATTQGIRAGYSDVDDGLKQIDQEFAEVDKAVEARNAEKLQKQEDRRKQKEQLQKEKEEQEKQKKEAEEKSKIEKDERHANRKLREEEAKKAIVGHEAEIRAEAEALAKAKKPIPDAFFDIRFRPSWNPVESKRQSDMCVEIGNKYILGQKNLPAGVKAVFEANYNKLRTVRNFVKNDVNKLESVELQKKFKEIETQFAVTEEMVKMEHASEGINYEPVTFDQLKLQHDLAKELNSSELKNAQQPKEPAPTELKKEDISKNI